MALCDSDADCRGGYACVSDFVGSANAVPFCNDERGEPPPEPQDASSGAADALAPDTASGD
jgi:hypothetical protein